jgi:hypothetical protein
MQSRQLIENKLLILIKPSTYRNINMLAVWRKPVVRRLREIYSGGEDCLSQFSLCICFAGRGKARLVAGFRRLREHLQVKGSYLAGRGKQLCRSREY